MPNFLKNIDLKILALLSSLMLWIFVVGIQNLLYTLPEPLGVEVLNLPSNVYVASSLPPIKVKVKIDQANLNKVNPKDFEAIVDAKDFNVGTHSAKIVINNKSPIATIVSTEPSTVSFTLEALSSKEIPVEVEVSGKPAGNAVAGETELNPAKISIEGPSNLLAKVTKAKANILLSGTETNDMVLNVKPELDPSMSSDTENIKFNPEQIQVKVMIKAKEENKVPDQNGSSGNSSQPSSDVNLERKSLMADVEYDRAILGSAILELLPRNILVTIEGPPEGLKDLNNKSLKVKLATERIEQGGIYNVKKEDILLPQKNLKVIDFSPSKIQIKF